MTSNSQPRHRALKAVMMTCGLVEALAAIAVVLPRAWMQSAYLRLHLGNMPDAALFGYLARSTSLLWAVHGVLIVALARDMERYLPLVRLMGYLTILMGVALLGIDLYEGVPAWWTAVEGPIVLVMGGLYIAGSR